MKRTLLANSPLKRSLVESLACSEKPSNPSSDTHEELKRDVIQYVRNGNKFTPVGDVVLIDSLKPCAYAINSTMTGIEFERIKPKTDELMMFEDSNMDKVVKEINRFWERKDHYDRLGLMHSRGIIMYGPPGTGKSACLQQVVEMMINRGDVVFFAKSSGNIAEGLKMFRQVEPTRRVVICFEEADELCKYDERTLLQLMDGDAKADNVLFLATTNYIDRLPPRMLRPGRFDKKILITAPALESRLKYLRHKLKDIEEDTKIQELAGRSDGFGFGHLRELIAGIYAMGEDSDEVIARLKAPIHESRVARPLINVLLQEEEKGEYFADYDEDTGMYCVFHTDKNTGHAFSSFASMEQAEANAAERNGK